MTRPLAPYDDGVPHPAPDAALASRFAAIRATRPAVDLERVRDVVLVVSSSRGGSSMLTEILRRVDGVLSLPGETNPHVVVAQLSGGDSEVFRAELARDVGRPRTDVAALDGMAADVHWRLTAQWPTMTVDADEVRHWVKVASQHADPRDVNTFSRAVLEQVAQTHSRVTTAAYDIGVDRETAPPPPTEPIVEMTPYVGFRPWRLAGDDELSQRPLVIATPRNSYRLEWLVELFPSARVRVLHLTRNPAASVNGLIDGWQSPWFHNVRVGARWWKYDVPPQWHELEGSDLPKVAAAQWRSAHAAVLEVVERTGLEVLRVRYEDLVGKTPQREGAAHAVAAFLGVEPAAMRAAVVGGVPPVMATAPPQRRRWSASHNDLGPALAEPAVWETTAALGYDVEERLWI